MRHFDRLPAPAVLLALVEEKERWVVYGERYQAQRTADAGHVFARPTVDKKPLNQHLLPFLCKQTQNHCSYCDGYPLDRGDNTIDHFKPKSQVDHYPFVCQWENLYVACNRCQLEKKEQYHADLLRPDASDFSFERYFFFDFTTFSIEINPRASLSDQQRASYTRTLLKLNSNEMKIKRQRAYDFFYGSSRPTIDDCDFRYMFDGDL